MFGASQSRRSRSSPNVAAAQIAMPSMIEFLLATVVLSTVQSPPSSYDTAKTAAVKTCDAIDANEYQTGLALNPDGYRSYYRPSQCFQTTAVQFRDRTLCDRVRQRRALLSSSGGYS